MTSKIEQRLSRLGSRRIGLDRISVLNEDSRTQVIAKSTLPQKWQKRAADKPFTRYALGAMQAVDADYTRVSIETAERVGNQLANSLKQTIPLPDFRLQGSVPLDIHIRGVSDVDLLVLRSDFLTYDPSGVRAQRGGYTSSSLNSVTELRELRRLSEATLREKFPAAKVDASGAKALKISGGSLARPVDVVPSHWHDNSSYQESWLEFQRGVTILDNKLGRSISNLPFLHIRNISNRCERTRGGLRKAIRLCKNLKADIKEEGISIELPSFDIAALMYHANEANLTLGSIYELSILSETQRFFDQIYQDRAYALNLQTPDGLRKVLDTEEKYLAAKRFSVHFDELLKEVSSEHDIIFARSPNKSLLDARAIANRTYIPAV